MNLIDANRLTMKEEAKLATVSRRSRPSAGSRQEFAALRQAYSRLKAKPVGTIESRR